MLDKCHRRLLYARTFAPALTCILTNLHNILVSISESNSDKVMGAFSLLISSNAMCLQFTYIMLMNRNVIF